MEKLDSLGVDHNIQLTDTKKTITEENCELKKLQDEKERAFARQGNTTVDIKGISDKISQHNASAHSGFIVSFDNVDIHQERRNMTLTDQNSDFHWVNHKMVEN